MFRKTLTATLALLIVGGTAFARPQAIQPTMAVSAGLLFAPKTKAIRFRVSRPVMARNPELDADSRQMSREGAAC